MTDLVAEDYDEGQYRTAGSFSPNPAKSHLTAVIYTLGHEACRQGAEVLFVDTHKMLQHLHGGRADGMLEKRLSGYLRPDVLILDDFGLRPVRSLGPEDLYDVINGRYEVGSIVVTSNRAPSEWVELFGDPLLASAGLDRLGDRAEVVIMRGGSFRAQRASQSKASETSASTDRVITEGAHAE